MMIFSKSVAFDGSYFEKVEVTLKIDPGFSDSPFLTAGALSADLEHLIHNTQSDDRRGSHRVHTIDDHADLHPFILDIPRSVREEGKDTGEDHKRGIAVNDDLRRRGFKRPVKSAQGKDGPWDEEHKGRYSVT